MKRLYLPIFLSIMLMAAVACGPVVESTPVPSLSRPLPVIPAPDFTLSLLGGGEVTLSQHRGKPVVLNFWTTWCPSCREELPLLESLHRKRKGKEFVLISVAIGEPEQRVADFAAKNGLSFPIALDLDIAVAAQYGVLVIPTTFLINERGEIVTVKVGPFNSEAEFERFLKALR